MVIPQCGDYGLITKDEYGTWGSLTEDLREQLNLILDNNNIRWIDIPKDVRYEMLTELAKLDIQQQPYGKKAKEIMQRQLHEFMVWFGLLAYAQGS